MPLRDHTCRVEHGHWPSQPFLGFYLASLLLVARPGAPSSFLFLYTSTAVSTQEAETAASGYGGLAGHGRTNEHRSTGVEVDRCPTQTLPWPINCDTLLMSETNIKKKTVYHSIYPFFGTNSLQFGGQDLSISKHIYNQAKIYHTYIQSISYTIHQVECALTIPSSAAVAMAEPRLESQITGPVGSNRE